MNRFFVVALISLSGAVVAEDIDVPWDKSDALPAPQSDTHGRAGHWWWPEQTQANEGDAVAWGNRGVVFGQVKAVEAKVAEEIQVPAAMPPYITESANINNIVFEFDSALLSEKGKREADKLISFLAEFPLDTVVILGHTCDLGDASYNQQLGLRRANAVKDYMVEQGFAEERITTVSKGETKPALPNDVESNRRFNRRVAFETVIGY
jgi:outer membrane protein OmpA-like peptidoglycan-associated protein